MGRHTACCLLLIGLLSITKSTACGTGSHITSEWQTISSPADSWLYFWDSDYYPSNLDCSWKVQAPRGKSVWLTKKPGSTFSLEESTDCSYDYVAVYDGENNNAVLLGRFCGYNFPAAGVQSSCSSLFVEFHTDSSVVKSGFKLSVKFVCGRRLTGSSGQLTSPGYGCRNYNNNAMCRWVIVVQPGMRVKLEFSSFHLEHCINCQCDSVNIYNRQSKSSTKLGSFCGSSVPPPRESTGSYMLVEFLSDGSETEQGFAASFTAVTTCGIQDPEYLPRRARIAGRPNSGRIVGGREANPHSWPWQVALYQCGRYICGGSIISHRHVLTAAHCVHGHTACQFSITAGDHNRASTSEGTEQTICVAAISVHEAYSNVTVENDIAVLHLAEDIMYTREVKPICLPREDVATNTPCITTGWGATRGTGNSMVLNEVRVPIMDRAFCRRTDVHSTNFSNTMVCAGYPQGDKDSCKGDSGGPLVCRQNKVYRLHGITSWGYGCALPRKPGVYTRVAQFVGWVNSKTSGTPYTAVDGDCLGCDIRQEPGTPAQCAAICNSTPECVGIVYVVAGTKPFPTDPCFLKSSMCEEPSQVPGLVITSYFKTQVAADAETNYCLTNPCMNGGTCRNAAPIFICTCRLMYIGNLCQSASTLAPP